MGREVQRALLWVILFGSLFMLWDNYQVYKGGKSFFAAPEETVEASQSAGAADIPAPAQDARAVEVQAAATPVKEPVVVTTDRMKVTFDLQGARVIGTEMLLFPQQADWSGSCRHDSRPQAC